MTTMQVQDIKRKKSVASRYAPNSYRIFSEEIDSKSLPYNQVYTHQASQLYTQPLVVPAQSIEDRNFPHGGRNAGFLRENVASLNEPINNINTRVTAPEKRWWEWNVPKEEMDSALKNKKRLSSIGNYSNNPNDINAYATTYQKDMGYLNNVLEPGTQIGGINENNGAAHRHTYNPNGVQAVGVVPVNDLNSYTKANEQQRVFVDKMSFEHNYDSRNNQNYAQRGRRQGAFVMDQLEPKKPIGLKSRPDSNSGSSVWSAMHPNDQKSDSNSNSRQTSGLRKVLNPNPSAKNDPNQRRDPIGYFNDNIVGGSMVPRSNNGSRLYSDSNDYHQMQKPEMMNPGPMNNSYEPSWNQANNAPYEPPVNYATNQPPLNNEMPMNDYTQEPSMNNENYGPSMQNESYGPSTNNGIHDPSMMNNYYDQSNQYNN